MRFRPQTILKSLLLFGLNVALASLCSSVSAHPVCRSVFAAHQADFQNAISELANLRLLSSRNGALTVAAENQFKAGLAGLEKKFAADRVREALRYHLKNKSKSALAESVAAEAQSPREKESETLAAGQSFELEVGPILEKEVLHRGVLDHLDGISKNVVGVRSSGLTVWRNLPTKRSLFITPELTDELFFYDESTKVFGKLDGMGKNSEYHTGISPNGRYLAAFDRHGQPRRFDLHLKSEARAAVGVFEKLTSRLKKTPKFIDTHVRDDGSLIGFKSDGSWIEFDAALKPVKESSFAKETGHAIETDWKVDLSPDETEAVIRLYSNNLIYIDLKTGRRLNLSGPTSSEIRWFPNYAAAFSGSRLILFPRNDQIGNLPLAFSVKEYSRVIPEKKFAAKIQKRTNSKEPLLVRRLDIENGASAEVLIAIDQLEPSLLNDLTPRLLALTSDGRRAAILIDRCDEDGFRIGPSEIFVVDLAFPILAGGRTLPESYHFSDDLKQEGFNASGDQLILNFRVNSYASVRLPVKIKPFQQP